MQELNNFKTNINLADFSTSFGYCLETEKSSKNAPVMRADNGEKIVIGRDKADNHYIYFNPNDDRDNGTIIDFIKNRTGESLGYIRRRCRAWLRSPGVRPNISVIVSTKDATKIANKWHRLENDEHIFSDFDGIKPKYIEELLSKNHTKMVKGELYFMLSDQNGICGFEKRTRKGEKFIEEGSTKGLFINGNSIDKADRIIIFESPMDMLAYKQLGMSQKNDFRVCTMGSIGETAKSSLKVIFERNQTAKVLYAVDNDRPGKELAEKIYALDTAQGRKSCYERPPEEVKDWKELLKNKKMEHHICTQSRGMGL